jgi:hypothetical protein
MLEACLTQGTGLHALAAKAMPRMVAMASHGDRESELPLLCALCTAWIELGYSVVVLDATVMESDASPGLLQILQSARNAQHQDPSQSLWPIFPARHGLEQLCREGSTGEAMLHLGQLFGGYNILMVYANAQTLASQLPDSGLCPVVTLSNRGNAILNTYQSLKQLLIMGHMEPTIVSLSPENDPASQGQSPTPAQTQLQVCAKDFLGHQITPLRIANGRDDDQPSADVNRLALRLLESAVKLDTRSASHQIRPLAMHAGKPQIARSY